MTSSPLCMGLSAVMAVPIHVRLRWDSMAPLGGPVVSRGVDEHGGVFRLNLVHAFFNEVRVFFKLLSPQFQKFFKGHHQGILEMAEPFQVPHNDLFQQGRPVSEAQPLVELLFVFHEKDLESEFSITYSTWGQALVA